MTDSAAAPTPATREEILRTLRLRIVRFATRRIGPDRAEDVAQEALLLLTEKYPQVERLEDLLPLTFRIVRLKMMALARKVRRRGEDVAAAVDELELASEEPGPALLAERRELLHRLQKAMRGLGDRCRDLLRHKLAGHGFAEIQGLMGAATLATVYTWDHRCRQRLVAAMGGDWEARR
jgi:RNA polymerase sigma-70 factor (ECF subfamily)